MTQLVEDIIRISALVISVGSAIFVFLSSIRNNNVSQLKKILKWFEKSFEDGKIDVEELKEGLELIKSIRKVQDKVEENESKSTTEEK